MTKQIRLKDGKVLKVESCGECSIKPGITFGFCPLSNKLICASNKIRPDCPLEEWQEPVVIKESLTTGPTDPSKLNKGFTMLSNSKWGSLSDIQKDREEFRGLTEKDSKKRCVGHNCWFEIACSVGAIKECYVSNDREQPAVIWGNRITKPAEPKDPGMTIGTADYLDKAAILKVWDKILCYNDLKKQIERGEFDIRVGGEAPAEKDAEIAQLKKTCEDKDQEIDRLIHKCCELAAEPHYLNGPRDRLRKASTEIDHLKDEINKRNKLLQDHSITFAKLSKENNRLLQKVNDLEKAKENRCPESCKRDCSGCFYNWAKNDEENKTFCEELMTEGTCHKWYMSFCGELKYCLKLISSGRCPLGKKPGQKEPPKDEPETVQKEPELWICPNFKGGLDCLNCPHHEPHTHTKNCEKSFSIMCPCDCTPVKKEPTVPEMQQQTCKENTVAGALHYDIEVRGRRIDAYAKKQIDFDIRLDALEIASKAHDQINRAHGKMIQDLQKENQPLTGLDPAVRYYPISEGELREAIKDNLPLSEEDAERNTKILAQILNRDCVN